MKLELIYWFLCATGILLLLGLLWCGYKLFIPWPPNPHDTTKMVYAIYALIISIIGGVAWGPLMLKVMELRA